MSSPRPAPPAAAGPAAGADLAERLMLVADGPERFVSARPIGGPHVFGGLLVGQALRAAALTVVPAHPARALHASFLVAGRGDEPLIHDVERTRDGASFATRRVVVHQGADPVLVLTADFHREEDGVEFEQPPGPGVPGPEILAVGRYHSPWVESRDVPVDAVPVGEVGGSASPLHTRRAWFRVTCPLPPDPALHQQAIAYLSDHGPTRAAREPHAQLADDARRQSVSLDHSVWFHRPADANRWLLSELAPMATGRGRGLAVGSLRALDGTLVATVAQEVLLRVR